jgi:hypothetical protein
MRILRLGVVCSFVVKLIFNLKKILKMKNLNKKLYSKLNFNLNENLEIKIEPEMSNQLYNQLYLGIVMEVDRQLHWNIDEQIGSQLQLKKK